MEGVVDRKWCDLGRFEEACHHTTFAAVRVNFQIHEDKAQSEGSTFRRALPNMEISDNERQPCGCRVDVMEWWQGVSSVCRRAPKNSRKFKDENMNTIVTSEYNAAEGVYQRLCS